MTTKELLESFPGARVAVVWCELMLDEALWAGLREQGPDWSLRCIRDVIRELKDEGEPGDHDGALEQTFTPDFDRYFRGKMGLL